MNATWQSHIEQVEAKLERYRKALEEIEEMGYQTPDIGIINASTCAAAALKPTNAA